MRKTTHTFPGKHKTLDEHLLGKDEQFIVDKLSQYFYVTRIIQVTDGTSRYVFALARPADHFSELLNYGREVPVLFADYASFEDRTLDAFEKLFEVLPEFRAERTIRWVISRDGDIAQHIARIVRDLSDTPIIIPFHYNDFTQPGIENIVRLVRQSFYDRDVFAVSGPLRSESYFFGREQFVQMLGGRHINGEVSFMFGLRRTGKTSIVYALERWCKTNRQPFLHFDCRNASNYSRNWLELVREIIVSARSKASLNAKSAQQQSLTPLNISDFFLTNLKEIRAARSGQPILIALDEIDAILPRTGDATHWSEGQDALHFWNLLRSCFQTEQRLFTWLAVGTNPRFLEHHTLCDKPNPLLGMGTALYVPVFSDEQVAEMCDTLGHFVGLKFTREQHVQLRREFGGHPFFIRQCCSKINGYLRPVDKPHSVRPQELTKATSEVNENARSHFLGVDSLLHDFHWDERELLRSLVAGKTEELDVLIGNDPATIRHLIGFGIVHWDGAAPSFAVEAYRRLIEAELARTGEHIPQVMRAELISRERRAIELRLRGAIRDMLKVRAPKAQRLSQFVSKLSKKRASELSGKSWEEIFGDQSPLYFTDLLQYIRSERGAWSEFIDGDISQFLSDLDKINTLRVDAHPKVVADEQLVGFQEAAARLRDNLSI